MTDIYSQFGKDLYRLDNSTPVLDDQGLPTQELSIQQVASSVGMGESDIIAPENIEGGVLEDVTIIRGSVSGIPNSKTTDISLLEKTHNLIFSVIDATTISWSSPTTIELLDSYSEVNNSSFERLGDGVNYNAMGQAFLNKNACVLDSCKFYLGKNLSPTGNAVAKLYATTGNLGTTAVRTGAAIATSDNLDVATITTAGLYTFTFSGVNRINLSSDTVYCIEVRYTNGNSSNFLFTCTDVTAPTHSGNLVRTHTTEVPQAISSYDYPFYIYGIRGEISFSNGRTFSIFAGNTGVMSALTYIYLDTAISSTILQTTTIYSNAIGANKSLIGIACNGSVTASFIPYGSGTALINGDLIGALSIVSENVAANAITTAKIAALAVETGNLAAGAVTTAKIAALAVTAAELSAGAVTTAKIAADAVTAAEIATGAVGSNEIAAGAVIAGKIAAGTIVAVDIAAGTITGAKIAATTITASNIAALTITAAEIAASTITGVKIAANTIQAANIEALTITAAELAAGAVIAGKIAALTIVAGDIAANTITAAKIAAATITTTEIAANTIVAGNIAASTITAAKMSVSQLSAITADLGEITAGTIVLPSEGFIRSGQTAYKTGVGFYLGNDAGTPKFSLGNSTGDNISWDGTIMAINGVLLAKTIKAVTNFENTGRFFITNYGSGTTIFNQYGAVISTSNIATSATKLEWQVNKNYHLLTSIFSCVVTASQINLADGTGTMFVGYGGVTVAGSGLALTVEHCGFKFVKSGGITTLYATQANGIETVSAPLTTVAQGDTFELIVLMRGEDSAADYYWRKNSGAMSAVTTLTTNYPIGGSNFIQFCTSNEGTAFNFNWAIMTASYEK